MDLTQIKSAHARISSYIRRTPLIQANPLKQPLSAAASLYLKLENLQIIGSFKARGAVNKYLTLTPEQAAHGIVTASGGNHGLGVAYAGWLAKKPATIYLPHGTSLAKAKKLEQWGAHVIFEGQVWDEANRAALQTASREGLTYFHPFADPAVIAGQGTIGLELLEDEPELAAVIVAIGGGGLISGISTALKALNPAIKVIGVEPIGAPTLFESVRSGRLIELPEIHTSAITLAPRQSSAINLDIIRNNVDDIVLVTDEEMLAASRWLWFELGIAAELSGAAAVAALLTNKVHFAPQQKVCALVCGAGSDGIA